MSDTMRKPYNMLGKPDPAFSVKPEPEKPSERPLMVLPVNAAPKVIEAPVPAPVPVTAPVKPVQPMARLDLIFGDEDGVTGINIDNRTLTPSPSPLLPFMCHLHSYSENTGNFLSWGAVWLSPDDLRKLARAVIDKSVAFIGNQTGRLEYQYSLDHAPWCHQFKLIETGKRCRKIIRDNGDAIKRANEILAYLESK